MEFTDVEDLEFVLENQPWYVCGQIFHLESLTTQFSDIDAINNLVVWARLPRVSAQYKKVDIIEVIAQPTGDVIRVDKVTNLFMNVLVEVDLRFPLKRLVIVNKDEDNPILTSYKKKKKTI